MIALTHVDDEISSSLSGNQSKSRIIKYWIIEWRNWVMSSSLSWNQSKIGIIKSSINERKYFVIRFGSKEEYSLNDCLLKSIISKI